MLRPQEGQKHAHRQLLSVDYSFPLRNKQPAHVFPSKPTETLNHSVTAQALVSRLSTDKPSNLLDLCSCKKEIADSCGD